MIIKEAGPADGGNPWAGPVFVPGSRHVVVGTKAGELELYDLSTGSCIQKILAHGGIASRRAGVVFAVQFAERNHAGAAYARTVPLEFRVQHDVATDADPALRTAPRGRVRRVLEHLAARRTAAQLRRLDTDLAELADLQPKQTK